MIGCKTLASALAAALILCLPVRALAEAKEPPSELTRLPLASLISEADTLGLPTKFLRELPPDFVTVTFEDLHRWAAEYHPEDHHMILNRSLSFNAAGGALRPLTKMTVLEVGNFFHELFHAYYDYLETKPPDPSTDGGRLLALSLELRKCRYYQVAITPVVQRRSATETRFLTERESWEALNETWGVFVGWAIWTKMELIASRGKPGVVSDGWLKRLKKADKDSILVGYYEPEDPGERAVAQKRYLAPSHRISPKEVEALLEFLFGESADAARQAAGVMQPPSPSSPSCRN